jgi:hypothetical protein
MRIVTTILEDAIQRRILLDKSGEEHFNLISAPQINAQ